VRDKYHGNNKVHAANGAGMRINQIGRSFVRTPNQNLVLNNVLYVPEANKSLTSIHRLTSDNHAFIEYHPNYFLIKDQATKKTILRGECEGGLYPLKSRPSSNKGAFSAVKSPLSRWHSRATLLLQSFNKSLAKNSIPFVVDLNKGIVCDAC